MEELKTTIKGEKPLKLRTFISYGLGDTGDNVMFATISSLVTLFYTDYCGISPATVALVMLVSRFLDGFSDLLFGFLMQRTRTKMGKCRPWLLGSMVPFSLSCIAIFLIPQGSNTMMFWYMFISYNFATTICYTISNLSQATLCSLMTRDSWQRERLGVFRLGLSPIGHILSAGCSLPLIHAFGNDRRAWVIVMTLWAIYALVVHFLCFYNSEEQVVVPEVSKEDKPSLGVQLKALFSNKYFWWAFAFWALWSTSLGLIGTTMSYYTRYVMGSDNYFTILYNMEKILWGVFILLTPVIRKKGFKKRTLLLVGCGMVVVAQALILINPTSVPLNTIAVIIRAIGQAPLAAFFNGIVADVVEYGQWRTHQRQEALIFSSGSVGTKIGSGLILAFVTYLLSTSGFVTSTVGGATQPDAAIEMIKNLYVFAPMIIFGIEALICSRYLLEDKLPGIVKELEAREAKGEL